MKVLEVSFRVWGVRVFRRSVRVLQNSVRCLQGFDKVFMKFM